MWGRAALIGSTGFVGGVLANSAPFARSYNSKTIDSIAGESFDTVVCAGAPANMWLANKDPSADQQNLERLATNLSKAKIGRTILISTIAVLANAASGCDETSAQYEDVKAYGRNRRMLETEILSCGSAHVLRLPALFGPGLKKNFLFDLMHPAPSFFALERFRSLVEHLPAPAQKLAERVYTLDPALEIMRLDRGALTLLGEEAKILIGALGRLGATAPYFTNSDSTFQFYNLQNLSKDIETAVTSGLEVLNVAVAPWRIDALHQTLVGAPFENHSAPIVHENMRTVHADKFGCPGPYLYSADQVLEDLRRFLAAKPTP